MADYYPSEIARLVLGYLKEVNCPEAWQAFLVECPDLQEHYRLLQNGRTCSTNIEGKSLLDILHEYRSLKASAQRNSGNEAHPSNLNSGASSSHVNANTSSSEIFKTPQKTNSEAFNRFRANQKSQTQATMTSIRNGQDNQSPKFSRTPNRLLVPRTPRRLQGVCVTTLNFNTDAERNETSQFTCRRSFESPRQTVSARQPLRESSMNKRSCFSDPAKSKPQMLSRTVQTEENVNASRSSANNIGNQISSHSSSGQTFSTSGDNSQNVASIGNSNSQEFNQSHRNVEFNVSSSNATHTGQNLNTLNSLMDSNKSTNVERQPTVVNQSIVFTSTEIRTGEDSNSVTPQFETEPPPYNRAPSTNSPRIILSYDRSQITSLTTPLKDKRQWSEEFSSPRRKGTIPKRRLLNESPHPKQLISNELGVIHEDLETLIDELLANQPLAQRLADNINKVIGHDELPRDPDCSNSSSFPTLQDINNSGEIIKSILARTETDPVFNDWFPFAFNSRDCDELNTIQESAAETPEPTFSGVGGTKITKDESIQTVFASKDETDSLKQTTQPPKQVSETETNTNQQTESTLQTHLTENIQNFTHSDQAVSHETESTKSQNATPAPNNEISKSVEETSGVNHSTEVSTANTAPRDVLDSCMSLIQPDGDEQLQDYVFKSSNVPDNANNNPSSTPASIPVIENKTMPIDTSALKPVSIGTPFQVETQMALTQSALNQNNTTLSSTSPMPISPAVQNTHICPVFNSSMPTTTLVQLPYSPMSTFVLPSSDAFRMQNSVQYRIVLPSVNWACNHATSEIIMPVQSEVNANVVRAADINSSPIKIPADFSPTKALNLKDNVANFITVTSENAPSKKKKKKHNAKSIIHISPSSDSFAIKKRNKMKPPRKKRRNLFSSPENPIDTDNSEIVDDIPVLSIPDPSPNKNESLSAMEILSNIVENKNTQSPILKAMISSAKILAEKGGRLNSTHVRALEFSSSVENEVNNEGKLTSKQLKTLSKSDGVRSSPRRKQKKVCNSPSCSPSKSPKSVDSKKKGNKCAPNEKSDVTVDLVESTIEQLNTCKSVPSSMSDVVLSAMQEALQSKSVNSKKQNSSDMNDVFNIAETNIDPQECPVSKMPSNSPNIKGMISREQYFPDSSDSDANSDNLPICVVAASLCADNSKAKEAELNSLGKNMKKSIHEAELRKKHTMKSAEKKSLVKMSPSTKLSSKCTPLQNKVSGMSECFSIPLKTKDSTSQKQNIEESANCTSELPASSINSKERCSSDKKDFSSDFSGKTSSKKESVESNTDKCSNKKEKPKPICSVKSSSKFDKNEGNGIMGLSDREGNSPFPLIVLDSDEEVEKSTEIDTSTIDKSESEDLNWSPKIQRTKQRKKNRKSKIGSCVKKKRSSTKNSSRKVKKNFNVSKKLNETTVVNEPGDNSLGVKKKRSSIKNSSREGEKNFNLSKKLNETTVVNEPGDNHQLNKDTDLPLSTTILYGSQSSPIDKKEKRSESKPSHFVSSPVKKNDVKSQKSVEKVKVSNEYKTSKKKKSIDELCDKLLQNASQSSPHKQDSSCPLVTNPQVLLLKLPADIIANKVNGKSSEKQAIEEMENTIAASGNKTFAESEIALQEISSKNPDGNKELVINSELKTNAEMDLGTKIISKESSNINLSVSNVKKRVVPPPKKRIRPVPVMSPCDQSFSPFSPFSSPAHSACLDLSLKSKEVLSLSTDPSNSEKRNTEILPEPEVTKSPLKIEVKRKCLSGKPKSMAEFYKNALPNRDGELPISPDPISSSSCTIDTFLARREMGILSESPSKKETNLIGETSFSKEAKKIIQKRKLSLNENPSSEEEGLIKSPELSNAVENPTDGVLSESSPIKKTHSTRKRKRAINENQSSDEECFFKSPKKGICSSKKKKLSLNENESSDEEGLIKSPPKISTTMKNPTSHNEPDKESFVKSPMKGICSSKKKKLSLNENESSDEEGLIKSPPKILTTMKNPTLHNEPDQKSFVKSPMKGICSSKKEKLSLNENESTDEEGLIKSPPKISTTMKNPALPNPFPAQDQINAHLSSDEEGLIISPVKHHNLEHNIVPTSSHIRKKQKLENVSNPNNQITYSIETLPLQNSRNPNHSMKNVDNVTEKSTHARTSHVNRPQPLYKIRQKSRLKEMINPCIPAGVKFPSKWSNSTIYNYSTAIKATTSEVDYKKESDNVSSSKGPRRSRPSIKVAFKSPTKRNSRVKNSFPKDRQSYSRYEVKSNPPFRTLYSARAAHRYNLGPRISPPRNSPYNLSRSTIDRHRVESKQTIPDNYICKETEKSFLKETTSKVYDGSGYTHGCKSNKDNVLTRNDSEAFDKSSNLNKRSTKVSDDKLKNSQISFPPETTFNEDFHSIQNVDENVSKNIKNVNVNNEKYHECEGQISETHIHLISETNKETLSHDKSVKGDSPQNPDSSVIAMPDKCPSSFKRTEGGNKFDKQRFPCDNPSVSNTEQLKDRESLNKDKLQEPNTCMLTMPDYVSSSFKKEKDKNGNQKQNSLCNKSDVSKTEESRKGIFANQDNVHYPGSYVLKMPDNIPSSFRIVEKKNRNQKRNSPSNRPNANKTEESRKEIFVNQDNVHNSGSCVLTMPDNMPSLFRKAEDKIGNQKQKPPCDNSDVSKTEESRKGSFANQDNKHNPGSYVLKMPDNIPSSFRIVEKKNGNQKRNLPSNRPNANKTEESRKETFVNQDNFHNLGSCVLTMPDNMPSTFRKAEDKIGNQKQKPPCDNSDVSKTEESRKGSFANQDNKHNPGSYVLKMPDNIPSSFRIVEKKNGNQKRNLPSNRPNANKTEESRKETFVNQDNVHNSGSCVLTMPDNMPSSFRKAEDKIGNQKQKPPCDNSDVSKTEESRKGSFANQDNKHNPGSYVLKMPDNIPSSFRIVEKKNRNQKRNSPSNRPNVNKTEESRKETFVNQDNVHNSGSCVLTMPDNMPSSFRKAEDKNGNQKQKPPCDNSDVSITEESRKGSFANQDNKHNPSSYVLKMPDNIPSSFRIVEKKNRNQKQKLPSNRSNVNKTEESRREKFANRDSIHNPDSYLSTIPDNVLSSFRRAEDKNGNQNQKFPCNISNNIPILNNKESVKDGKAKNSNNFLLITMRDKPPSSFSKTVPEKILPCKVTDGMGKSNSLCHKVAESTKSICNLEKVSLAKPSVGQTTSSKSGIGSSLDKKCGFSIPQNVDLQTEERQKEVPEGCETLLNSENCVQGQNQESGRLSVDQNELEQAVAFLTHNAGGESQEPVMPPSQNNSNINSESQATAPKDFASLWTQMSELFSPTESKTETPSTSRSKAEKLMVLMNEMKSFALGDVVQQLEKQKES